MKKRNAKRNQKRNAPAALVNYVLETRLAMIAGKMRSMMELAREERVQGREEVADGIERAAGALRAQLLCERMGWPAEVARQLAAMGLSQPLPSDRLICLYADGIAEGCSYSEQLQAGRTYVARDVTVDAGVVWSLHLVGVLGGLDEYGMENAWYPDRFVVLDDVKVAFARARVSSEKQR